MTDQQHGPYGGQTFDPYAPPSAGAHAAPAEVPADQPDPDPGGWYRRDQPQHTPAPPVPAPAPQPAPAPPPTSSSSAPAAGASDGDEDFDAWLAEYATTQPTVKMYGERVPIPFDVPLWITQRVENGDADLDTLRTMVDAVYGEGMADRWISRGAGGFGLGVILAWTILRTQGQRVGFADAVARAEELGAKAEEQKAQQRAVNDRLSAAAAGGGETPEARAERLALEAMRDQGKARSSGGGAPWSPTSGASTGSPAPS